MRRLAAVLCVLAAGCAAGTAALKTRPAEAPPWAPWRVLTSDHFVLKTDLGPEKARQVIEHFEFARVGLVQAILGGSDPERTRLEVVAFASPADFAPYRDSIDPEAWAYVDAVRGTDCIVIGAGLDYMLPITVSHELAHHMSRLRYLSQPPWFSEGMAQFFASVSRPPSRVYASGMSPFPSEIEEAAQHPLSVRDLFEWRATPDRAGPLMSWSHVLVHYLLHREVEAFNAFGERLAAADEPRSAWNETFPQWNLDIPDRIQVLDRALDQYRRAPDEEFQSFDVLVSTRVQERLLNPAEATMVQIRLRRAWKPGELETELAKVLAVDPTNVEALTMLAASEPSRAPELAQRAVQAHGDDSAAWELVGRWPGTQPGYSKQQEAAYRRAVELAPHDPHAAIGLATKLVRNHRAEEALTFILRARREAPSRADGFLIAAYALATLGRCDEARASGNKVLVLNAVAARDAPDTPRLLEEWYRRCRPRSPAAPEADEIHRQADEAVERHDDESAARFLEQVIAKDPLRADARAELGRLYEHLGRHAEAVAALRALLDIVPNDFEAWFVLGLALEGVGQKAEAEAAIRRHLEIVPDHWRAHHALGRLLIDNGRGGDAVAAFERAAKFAPPPAGQQRYDLGWARLHVGDAEVAVRELELAVATGDPNLMNDAAFLLADAGVRLDRAGEWTDAAISKFAARLRNTAIDTVGPGQLAASDALLRAWDTLGWVRFKEGKLADAERYLVAAEEAQAAAGLDDAPTASDHFGQLMEREGRREEAIAAYARALLRADPPEGTRARLVSLAGEGRVAELVARAGPGGTKAIQVHATGAVGATSVLVVLGSTGSILALRPRSAQSVPPIAEAMRGAAHGIHFPDARTDKLVAPALFRCSAGACSVELGVEAEGKSAASTGRAAVER